MDTTRTTLVVGGTSGIGLAAARQLAGAGDTVHVASRSSAKVSAVTDENITAHQLDGNDAAAVAELAASIAPIDALVITLSGGEGSGLFADLDIAVLRRAFDAKFWPVVTVLQTALPHLAEHASITVAGAISAHAAMPGTAGIGALNAAVESLVRPLSVELAPRRINAVSPGLVDTPWWDGIPEQARNDWFESAAKELPLRHVSSADEIAEAVVFLSRNTSTTGTILTVDAGARFVQL